MRTLGIKEGEQDRLATKLGERSQPALLVAQHEAWRRRAEPIWVPRNETHHGEHRRNHDERRGPSERKPPFANSLPEISRFFSLAMAGVEFDSLAPPPEGRGRLRRSGTNLSLTARRRCKNGCRQSRNCRSARSPSTPTLTITMASAPPPREPSASCWTEQSASEPRIPLVLPPPLLSRLTCSDTTGQLNLGWHGRHAGGILTPAART